MARRYLRDNSHLRHMDMPRSRDEALALGVVFYFSGKPCRWRKHLAPRHASTGSCARCQSEASRRCADKDREAFREASRAKYARNRSIILARARARYQENLETERAKALTDYYADHEREKARRRASYWRNHEKRLESHRRRRQEKREQIAAYNKEYKARNRHIYAAAQKVRETRISRAMPKWVDPESIKAIYEEARRLTVETGVKHEVDHIVPLQGRNSSGLHVPANLRVVTKLENVRKSNRLIEALICASGCWGAAGTVRISVSP